MCRTKFRHILTNYTRIDFAIIPENGIEKHSSHTLVSDDGETIGSESLREYLVGILMRRKREASDIQPGDHVERIRLLPDNLSIVNTDTGASEKVRQITLVAYSRNEEIELPASANQSLN